MRKAHQLNTVRLVGLGDGLARRNQTLLSGRIIGDRLLHIEANRLFYAVLSLLGGDDFFPCFTQGKRSSNRWPTAPMSPAAQSCG